MPDIEDTCTLNFSEKVLNRALLHVARIEFLEAENQKLKDTASTIRLKHFKLKDIVNDDSLIGFYTDFPLQESLDQLLLSFTTGVLWYSNKCNLKLDPKNQFFLTLVQLRLNA